MFERDWIARSKYDDHSKFDSQHDWVGAGKSV